jgi:hypothetical protein
MKIANKKIRHELEIKNNGIEFSVKDSKGKHLGDFYVRKSGVVWCRGQTTVDNGESISWTKLIGLAEQGFRSTK